MAKSGTAEDSVIDGRRMAEERKKELQRLVEAIMEDDLGSEKVYEDAERAIAALRERRVVVPGRKSSPLSSGLEKKQEKSVKNSTVELESGVAAPAEVPVPKHFLCPLSSAIMRDPVVVSSGETYDRAYIQQWLNSGKRTCPQTQQVLSYTVLTPNHLVRGMISQWCTDNGIVLRPPENPENEGLITSNERSTFSTLMIDLFSPSHAVRKQAVKSLRQLTKRGHSFRATVGENPAAIPQLLSILSEAGEDIEVREDAVTALLTLSIHEPNKKQIGESSGIPLLIKSVKISSSMSSRANAAAALFSLAALDSNKSKIGELGAIPPLVELLGTGTPAAKKDAASAIFSLCVVPENRVRAVRAGAVDVCLSEIADVSSALVDESLSLLALLSPDQDAAAAAAAAAGGVPVLLEVLRDGKSAKNTENAVVVLQTVCMIDRRKLREVGEEEAQHGTISKVAYGGTARAVRKAVSILDRLKKTMHSDRHSY